MATTNIESSLQGKTTRWAIAWSFSDDGLTETNSVDAKDKVSKAALSLSCTARPMPVGHVLSFSVCPS